MGTQPPLVVHRARKNGMAFLAIALCLYASLGTLAQRGSPLFGLMWSEAFALLLPACIAAAGSNLKVSRALLLSPAPPRSALALAPLIGGAAFVAAGALMALTSLLLPEHWLEVWDISRFFERPLLERVALSLAASTLAPFCEEVAFHGWLLTALRTRHRTGLAIGLSGLYFAAMHLDPVRFLALLALGVLYGWMTWRAGSVWPAIFAHTTNNGLGVCLAALGATQSNLGLSRPQLLELAGAASFTLALAACGLAILTKAYSRVTPSPPHLSDALALRDPTEPSTAFRFARIPRGQLAAIAAAALSLTVLTLLAVRSHQ